MISRITNFLIGVIHDMVTAVLLVLPNSPFQSEEYISVMSSFSNLMSNINYFIPFGTIFQILTVYVGAVLAWYAARWVLRLAQYIQ